MARACIFAPGDCLCGDCLTLPSLAAAIPPKVAVRDFLEAGVTGADAEIGTVGLPSLSALGEARKIASTRCPEGDFGGFECVGNVMDASATQTGALSTGDGSSTGAPRARAPAPSPGDASPEGPASQDPAGVLYAPDLPKFGVIIPPGHSLLPAQDNGVVTGSVPRFVPTQGGVVKTLELFVGIFGGVVALVGEAGMTTPPFATAEEPSSAFGPGGLLAEMTIVTQRGHSAARPADAPQRGHRFYFGRSR